MQNITSEVKQEKKNIEKLSVVISEDSFLYGYADKVGNIIKTKFIGKVNFSTSSELSEALKNEVKRLNISTVSVCSKQLPFLHIHRRDDELCNYYPSFEMYNVFRDKFTGEEVYNYFGLTNEQIHFLDRITEKYTLHHFSTLLAHYYYPGGSDGVHVDFEESNFSVFYSDNKGFKFYNRFSFQTHEDVLYFIISVYNFLGTDPLSVKLHLSGLIDKSSALYRLIYGYFAYVDFKSPYPCIFNTEAENHPDHYYFDIATTVLCE